MNWHLLSNETVASLLGTSEGGLDPVMAQQKLEETGENRIREGKKKTVFSMILNQLSDFMIVILIGSAVLSGFLGDPVDTLVILAIVVVNAVVGFIQEFRAEKALEALKKMASTHARVVRGKEIREVPAAQLVPGDVVWLEAGNLIPADVRFVRVFSLQVDESALTGESHPVEKVVYALPEGHYSIGDQINLGFKGTSVTRGRAMAYVVGTGMQTELGRIASMIQTVDTSTPLQKRLESFGKRLSLAVLVICLVIFGFGLLRGEGILPMLLTSLSLAVAAIPEALPALVTITLALGAKRLVKSQTLIRKLPAVETLGSVSFICTDKTGTLTRNKMAVEDWEKSEFHTQKADFSPFGPLLFAMALNNDSVQHPDGTLSGESTELALLEFAQNEGCRKEEAEKRFPRMGEIPFDSNRKCMTTFHRLESGQVLAFTKGAVDVLLGKLAAEEAENRSRFERRANDLASRGYRVMGFGVRFFDALPENLPPDAVERDLHFLGLGALIDPPREEARDAVAACKRAGVTPVMITGDHKLTAMSIARSLGILQSESDQVLTGAELENLTEPEFEAMVEQVRVYARVSPEQKLNIVKALQARGQFVAMTGDGVNDAPALKNADIGIAMGINGTEVSKEAAHMILMDDNFATLVTAIHQGRRIYDNILKFITYTMTSNSGEIWAIFLAPFLGLPIPLLAIHILWINLVTDGLPGLALANEPAEANAMSRPPRKPDEGIFTRGLIFHIFWVGLLMGLVTLAVQAFCLHVGWAHWQTMAFTVLCFSQLGNVLAIRSGSESVFRMGFFSNPSLMLALAFTAGLQLLIVYLPFFQPIFKTQALSLTELLVVLATSTLVFWAVEAEKWWRRRRENRLTSSQKPGCGPT